MPFPFFWFTVTSISHHYLWSHRVPSPSQHGDQKWHPYKEKPSGLSHRGCLILGRNTLPRPAIQSHKPGYLKDRMCSWPDGSVNGSVGRWPCKHKDLSSSQSARGKARCALQSQHFRNKGRIPGTPWPASLTVSSRFKGKPCLKK